MWLFLKSAAAKLNKFATAIHSEQIARVIWPHVTCSVTYSAYKCNVTVTPRARVTNSCSACTRTNSASAPWLSSRTDITVIKIRWFGGQPALLEDYSTSGAATRVPRPPLGWTGRQRFDRQQMRWFSKQETTTAWDASSTTTSFHERAVKNSSLPTTTGLTLHFLKPIYPLQSVHQTPLHRGEVGSWMKGVILDGRGCVRIFLFTFSWTDSLGVISSGHMSHISALAAPGRVSAWTT